MSTPDECQPWVVNGDMVVVSTVPIGCLATEMVSSPINGILVANDHLLGYHPIKKAWIYESGVDISCQNLRHGLHGSE